MPTIWWLDPLVLLCVVVLMIAVTYKVPVYLVRVAALLGLCASILLGISIFTYLPMNEYWGTLIFVAVLVIVFAYFVWFGDARERKKPTEQVEAEFGEVERMMQPTRPRVRQALKPVQRGSLHEAARRQRQRSRK